MQENRLIGGIWDGACRVSRAEDSNIFNTLIRSLIPVQVSVFEMQGWGEEPVAVPEDYEPIPGICLGDILAEELNADVPFGSLVVIRREDTLSNMSHAVGAIIGEALLRVVGRGMFPLADEDSILFGIGLVYFRAAQSEELVKLGLDTAAFRAGLNGVLARYWAQPDEKKCLFTSEVMLNNLPIMSRELTHGDVTPPPLAALRDFSAAATLNQWTLKLKSMIGDLSACVARPAQCRNVGLA